ncbi:hypothetical protein [Brevibacillus laterosporus]
MIAFALLIIAILTFAKKK